MNKLILLSLSLATLTSCTFANQTYLPDGSQGYAISCGGTLNNMGACYQKAGEVCGGGGYKIYGQDESRSPFLIGNSGANGSVSGNTGMYSSNSSVNAGNFVSRNLIVKCSNLPKKE